MSELVLPKLRRFYRLSSGQSTSGFWPTRDGRFLLCKRDKRWTIRNPRDPGDEFLAQHRIGRHDTSFPTRREALEALATALHAEEHSYE
jgi:hypothetical protein